MNHFIGRLEDTSTPTKTKTVPVVLNYDHEMLVGEAEISSDGSAIIKLYDTRFARRLQHDAVRGISLTTNPCEKSDS